MEKEAILMDVFTDTPFTGNQLAVFPDPQDLTDSTMLKLANEINYSETTFIFNSSDPNADYDIRIFTPKQEIPFAGHPTLGSAYTLLNILEGKLKNKNEIRLKTKAGIIPLQNIEGKIWMVQNQPEFFEIFKNKIEIAELIGLEKNELSDEYPIEEVSTGNPMLMIPIKSLASIQRANGNQEKISDFFKDQKSLAPYLFSFETVSDQSKVHSRLFAPHIGILEDPATGSAAGPLTGYLLKYRIFGEQFEIQNEQGLEMGRPSKIFMRGKKEFEKLNVEIGGQCVYMGRSTFNI